MIYVRAKLYKFTSDGTLIIAVIRKQGEELHSLALSFYFLQKYNLKTSHISRQDLLSYVISGHWNACR
jgi:hypothetical protein